jgi:hypothetical protein
VSDTWLKPKHVATVEDLHGDANCECGLVHDIVRSDS